MNAGGWFGRRHRTEPMENVPDGVASKCAGCDEIVFVRELERNLEVCPKCGHHHRLGVFERLAATIDEGSFVEIDADLVSTDPLGFPGYADKLGKARDASGLNEAIVTGMATIEGRAVVVGVADFRFMGGSMGSVVGEKIARAFERAIEKRVPIVIFSASGGARMQEGLVALMQMAKTSAAARRAAAERVPFISVLTDPTTGGVFASYASLGDIILAEPGATVGFAGRRVGQQDMDGRLPANFQSSEFQSEHGFVDRVVPRKDMRATLAFLIGFLTDAGDAGGAADRAGAEHGG
jgi:acetyl-CoA carboxylase carboxyl transferase subunit beta